MKFIYILILEKGLRRAMGKRVILSVLARKKREIRAFRGETKIIFRTKGRQIWRIEILFVTLQHLTLLNDKYS